MGEGGQVRALRDGDRPLGHREPSPVTPLGLHFRKVVCRAVRRMLGTGRRDSLQ